MMEFWHCHKPNEPHNHEQQTDKKGYSADSKLAITPSVGLVNATSFVLAAADCDNIKVGELSFFILWAIGGHSGTEKNRRFSAARLLYMEDSGYCCPKANLSAAWNLLQPLRKLLVLWRSNAPYFLRSHRPVQELMGVADISAQIHTHVLYEFTIMFYHSASVKSMLINVMCRRLRMLRPQTTIPSSNAPCAMPLSAF